MNPLNLADEPHSAAELSASTTMPTGKQAVAVIHGLGSHRLLMVPLVYRLRAAGFEPTNFGYRSWFGTIQDHAQDFAALLQRLNDDPEVERLHVVAHSLGSIVTRAMLTQASFSKLHRVVMLAPPNQGSPAATRVSYLMPLSQTVKQLSPKPHSFVNQLGPEQPPAELEFGVVAASYDFVVSPESSRLPFEHQHVTVFSGHNGLLVRKSAARQTIEFLKHGTFV